MQTVNDFYKYTKVNSIKLLSDYSASFWEEYKNNYEKYDSLFTRYFRNFKYFEQNEEADVETNVSEFIDQVYNHLMINHKRYSELFRIHTIADAEYSITDNYTMKEVMDRDTTFDKGNETDSGSNTIGSVTDTNSVAPYDEDRLRPKSSNSTSARTDTNSMTSGARHDSGTEDYTLTKTGNIGIQSVTDLIKKHRDFWSKESFYEFIFKEIAKELLLV